jgi:hypothetical protein
MVTTEPEPELPQRRPCPNLSVEFLAHQRHISDKISSLHVFAQQGDVYIRHYWMEGDLSSVM